MGQYSALVAAGSLALADAVRLVRLRGDLMQASGAGRPGAMAALIGLDDARLPDVLAAGPLVGILTVANRNSPGQVVLSGERPAVEAAVAAAKEAARVEPSSCPSRSPPIPRSWPTRPPGWRTPWPGRVRRPASAAPLQRRGGPDRGPARPPARSSWST